MNKELKQCKDILFDDVMQECTVSAMLFATTLNDNMEK